MKLTFPISTTAALYFFTGLMTFLEKVSLYFSFLFRRDSFLLLQKDSQLKGYARICKTTPKSNKSLMSNVTEIILEAFQNWLHSMHRDCDTQSHQRNS